ncbi:hypothetical protein [Brachybacterium sp. GU-2]|uniref:hypothetical protein n=1 Tax=Brachybacterium sp. GU-2 TaxID=3069708 RepID=UPI00280AA3E5|nr:hypothetical protein [Brachybacterium sp. GU-2]WME24457.1 hypothetical protein RBL05_07095 [Brachybacterium sp. GU-2]
MPDMHDDAADQLMRQLRARMLTTSVHADGEALPATPRRYFDTAERLALVPDVQAVQGGGVDGGAVIHVGEYPLTPSGSAALRDHLGELLAVLGGDDGSADPSDPTAHDTG